MADGAHEATGVLGLARHAGSHPLQGREVHRLVDEAEIVVLVLGIGPRGDIYK